MSSSMQGMDTEAGRQVGQNMGQHAQAVSGLVGMIGGAVGAMKWEGPDRQNFLSDWEGSFAPQAQNCSETLQEQGQVLCRHADRQDEVSS
jgi:hypothetical protein